MPCHCDQCSDSPAPTYTESFRHKTEVEHIGKQGGAWIREYLEGIKEKRGYAAYKKLRDDVEIEYRKLRGANADNHSL